MNRPSIPGVELEYKAKFSETREIVKQLVSSRALDRALDSTSEICLEASKVLDSYALTVTVNHYLKTRNMDIPATSSPIRPPWQLRDTYYSAASNLAHVRNRGKDNLLEELCSLTPPQLGHTGILSMLNRSMYRTISCIAMRAKSLFAPHESIWMVGNIYNYATPLRPLDRFLQKFKLYIKTLDAPSPLLEQNQPSPNLKSRQRLRQIVYEELTSTLPHDDAAAIALCVALNVPVNIFEDRRRQFQHILAQCQNRSYYGYFTFSYWHSEQDTFCAAVTKQLGKKLMISQHGGYYGYRYSHGLATLEFSVADYFITWGWLGENIDSDERHTTKFLPQGSHYLRNLRGAFGHKDHPKPNPVLNQYTAHPRTVLYLPTKYDSTPPYRVDLPFLEYDRIKSELIESWKLFFDFIKNHKLELFVKLHMPDSEFEHIFFSEAKRMGVSLKQVPCKHSSIPLYSKVDMVVWDTIGTGFLETNAIAKPTFLLPSAKFQPTRSEVAPPISPAFFINSDATIDLMVEYQRARTESWPFLSRFGHPSKQSLEDFLIEFPKTHELLSVKQCSHLSAHDTL